MQFQFATATKIIFGPGTIKDVPSLAEGLGDKILVVTGKNTKRAEKLLTNLKEKKLKTFTFSVSDEPSVNIITSGTELARKNECNTVIGFGGGSVLDTGKAISALITNKKDLMDYLEVIGKGKAITENPVPYIAVPTTSGTGAEVTRNAVIKSLNHKVKVSLRSYLMLPHLAVIDPVLTISMPPSVTASTGLDALTQLIEPYVCSSPNPLTDAICREGIKRAASSLFKAYENGNDLSARTDMSLASLFSGMALANAKLGAAHGFAGPMGGMFPAPHGIICARLLPLVMKANVKALKERKPGSSVISRFLDLSRLLTGKGDATLDDGLQWLYDLCDSLSVPQLSNYGVTEDDIPEIVLKAGKSSSMKGNPVLLTEKELSEIIRQAL